MSHARSGALHLLSESQRQEELVAAVREKGRAIQQIIRQVASTPAFLPFQHPCRRLLSLSNTLRLLISHITNPSPRVCASFYALLGCYKLMHGTLSPFLKEHTPAHYLALHMRENGALLAKKLESMRQLFVSMLHEIQSGILEQDISLRQALARSATNSGTSASSVNLAAANDDSHGPSQKKYLSASSGVSLNVEGSEFNSDGSSSSGGGMQMGLSSSLQFQEEYFGSDPINSPYRMEKIQAQRKQIIHELLKTYREFPPMIPSNAMESFGRRKYEKFLNSASNASQHAPARVKHANMVATPPFCADLYSPLASPLVLPHDYIPSVRVKEFGALKRAFQQLLVMYNSGSNVHANPTGPRIIFIHGEPGVGGQEYAKYVLHHLLDQNDPSSTAHQAKHATSSAAAAVNSSSSAPAGVGSTLHTSSSFPTFSPTSPPSYTSNYFPYHFAYNRTSQYVYRRRTESILDSIQRKLKRSMATTVKKDSISSSSKTGSDANSTSANPLEEDVGSSILHSASSLAEPDQNASSLHSSNSAAQAAATSSSTSKQRSAIPPLEKEKLHSMHRLRVDSQTVMKSLLTEFQKSSGKIGGNEWENGIYLNESECFKKYRQAILDNHSLVLLSNVHKNDEGEIEKLLFPPATENDATTAEKDKLNKAIFIIQTRQPLKALMRRCANHAVVQQLLPMDETQSMNALLKFAEKRTQLRNRQIQLFVKQQQALQPATSQPVAPITTAIPAFLLPQMLPAHLRVSSVVEPGHAIRLAPLCHGSIFLAKLLVKQLECGIPFSVLSKSKDKPPTGGRLDTRGMVVKSQREIAEWICTSLENKPSSLVSYLVDHYFPSSMKDTIAPPVAFVFSLLSQDARSLFISMSYVLAGCQSFDFRTLKAIFPHYDLGGAVEKDAAAEAADGAAHGVAAGVFRPNQLEADIRELLERGFLEQLGEFSDTDGIVFFHDPDEEGGEEHEADEESNRPDAVSVSLTKEDSTSTGSPATAAAAAGASTLNYTRFHSLTRCRFRIHEIVKEFGLAIANSSPNSDGGGSAFAKNLGSSLAKQFCEPKASADKYRRSLQLNYIHHFSYLIQMWEKKYQMWWQAIQEDDADDDNSSPNAGGEDGDDDDDSAEDGDEEEIVKENTALSQHALLSSFHQSATSPITRRRTQTLSSLSSGDREKVLRERNQLRVSLVSTLLEEEEQQQKQIQATKRASRASFRSSGGRLAFDPSADSESNSGAPPPRRSTLLLTSRGRNEESTLPVSSFRSLPHAKPTELVYKTVKKLKALMEDEEEIPAAGATAAAGTNESPAKPVQSPEPTAAVTDSANTEAPSEEQKELAEADAAVLSSTPPMRSRSIVVDSSAGVAIQIQPAVNPASDSSEDDDEKKSENESDESDDDEALSCIPLAELDDVEPEEGMRLHGPRVSVASPRELKLASGIGTVAGHLSNPSSNNNNTNSSHVRNSSGPGRLESAFLDLQAVLEEENAEEEEEEAAANGSALVPGKTYYDAAEFPSSNDDADDDESDDEVDSSDEEYEEVGDGRSSRKTSSVNRSSVVRRTSAVPTIAPTGDRSEVALLLMQMNEADDRSRRALRMREKLAARRRQAEEEREAAENRALEEDSSDVIDYGRNVLPKLFPSLGEPIPLYSLGSAGSSSQPRLTTLATAVMQATTKPFRKNRGGGYLTASSSSPSVGARQRSGTTFAPDAAHTPSFIRSLQLSKLMYHFDLDLTSVLTALLYSYHCSKNNLHAVLLFSPKSLYATRFSSYMTKQIYFHFLEIYKPRYSKEWMNGLWHLSAAYKSMGFLQKARDCMEEIRLIAQRQSETDSTSGVGVRNLLLSQIGLASIHQAQLHPGKIAKFGSWIDNFNNTWSNQQQILANNASPTALLTSAPDLSSAEVGSYYGGVGAHNSLAYPATPLVQEGVLTASQSFEDSRKSLSISQSSTQQFVGQSKLNLPITPLLTSPQSDLKHIHSILDVIIECYERALSTLERNSMTLLSESALSAPFNRTGNNNISGSVIGVHLFNRTFMFLFHRLGVFYTYKNAFQNALNMFRRMIEMKASEVSMKRVHRARVLLKRREAMEKVRQEQQNGATNAADLQALFYRRSGTNHISLLPFSLPSTRRFLSYALFGIGLVYFRAGDLPEALEYFERARRVIDAILQRRYLKEKLTRDSEAFADEKSDAASTQLEQFPEGAWIQSNTFLSSLATPQQASDVLTYVRCVYMQSCTFDRMAQQAGDTSLKSPMAVNTVTDESADAPPIRPANELGSYYAYLSLMLRSKIVGVWNRVTFDSKLTSFHEDMFKVTVGMSTLEAIQ